MKSLFIMMNGAKQLRRKYQVSNNNIPPLYGLREDHKVFNDPNIGPPTTLPVCGAVASSNYRISYFISQFLKPVIKSASEACKSTEDMLSKIRECNKNEDLEDCIVGGC